MPGHAAYPAGGTTAIGAGVDANNQNAQLAESIPATVKAGWHAEPPVCDVCSGAAASAISVAGTTTLVLDEEYQVSYVSAYQTSTGKLEWRQQYQWARNIKIDSGLVYVAYDDPTHATRIDARDITTGKLRWSAYDGGDFDLTIGSGLIMDNVQANNATTGTHAFDVSIAPHADTEGTPFITGGRIYYNSSLAIQAYTSTGKLLWSYAKPDTFGSGGGNSTPALHNGLLYLNSIYDQPTSTTLVLNPATGKVVRTLPHSDQPIAFDGTTGIFTRTDLNEPAVISAVNLITGHVYWTHRLPVDQGPWVLWGAPVVENGLVWILDGRDTGTPGHLAALSETTGVTKSRIIEDCPITWGSLVIAQHRIFAPSNCGVLTYTAA